MSSLGEEFPKEQARVRKLQRRYKMNINDLTIGQVKELGQLLHCDNDSHPYPVGQNVFIRTVTMYYTGKLIAVYPSELQLENAAWIADTGSFAKMLSSGEISEVEPIPEGKVVIGRMAVIDCIKWSHKLPRSQK